MLQKNKWMQLPLRASY